MFSSTQCGGDDEKVQTKSVESKNVIDMCENGTTTLMQQNKQNNKSLKNICFAGNKTIKNYNKRLQRTVKPNKNAIGIENTDFYCLNIKASLSTTSLSQQKEQQHHQQQQQQQRNYGHNGIIAKIKTDRPYHSLKRNIRHQSDCKLNHKQQLYNKRYSWSGGHNYKSSNVCASALNGTNGKDDLWGAIQTNYNYIMDTDLLENCKDTHGEINGVPNLLGNPIDCCSKILNVVERTNAASGDAKELRQWLRKMEQKLQKAPTTSEATLYSVTELQRLSQEHAVLYHQIVSYALVVRACIRAAKEQERRSNCATLTTLSNVGVQNENCDCRSLIVFENHNPTATHLSYKIISTKRNNAVKPKVASPPALLLKTQSGTKKVTTKHPDFFIASTENIYTKNSKESSNEPIKVNTIIDNGLQVGSSDSEDDFESLEKLQYRYYLIYLKAYEVQLLFDAILREKSTTLKDLTTAATHDADVYRADNKFKVLPKENAVDLGSKNGKSADISTEAILEMIRKNKKKSSLKNGMEDMKLSTTVQLNNLDTLDGSPRNLRGMCADKNIINKNNNSTSDVSYASTSCKENNLKNNNTYTCKEYEQEKYLKYRNNEFENANIENETALKQLPPTSSPLSNNSVISFQSFCMLPQQTDTTISVDLTTRTISSYSIPTTTTSEVQMSVTDCEADSENSDLDATLCSNQDSSTSTSHNNNHNNNNNEIKIEEKFYGVVKRSANNLSKISTNQDFNLIYAFPNVSFGMKEVTQLQKQLDKKLLQQKLDKKIKSADFSKLNKLSKTTTSNITDFELANKSYSQNISSTNGGGLLFDTTRFNHSNRKSKNCAIFYFKHMDTDDNEEPCISSGAVEIITVPNKYELKENESKLDSSIDDKIKKLVFEADQLVVDETVTNNFNQPSKLNLQNVKIASTVEELMEERNKKRVQEWLEHQPDLLQATRAGHIRTTEIDTNKINSKINISTETVSLHKSDEEQNKVQAETDTSEDLNDSIATCVRTSYCTSNEQMGGSANVLSYECGSSNQSLNIKVVKRQKNAKNNRKSERPWSVSCLSQLNRENQRIAPAANISIDSGKSANLAIHSISESALDSLSPNPCLRLISHASQYEGSNAVSTFKRRRVRKKKISQNSAPQLYIDTESGSGSDDLHTNAENTFSLKFKSCATISMLKSIENMEESAVVQVLEHQLLPLDSDVTTLVEVLPVLEANEIATENTHLSLLRNSQFRMGALAAPMRKNLNFFHKEEQYFADKNMSKDLILLMNEEDPHGGFTTGTDDHNSSFSETAWDDYQEKYNSENYSEGFDSDAARRLLEFGDDYRNFIDSQSDCCSSSLSAVNKIDSLSPPSINSLQEKNIMHAQGTNHTQQILVNTQSQKSQDNDKIKEAAISLKDFSQNSEKMTQPDPEPELEPTQSLENLNNTLVGKEAMAATDKTKFGRSVQSLRRSSESDTSIRRKKSDTCFSRRRRSNLEKNFKVISTRSSTSDEDAEQQAEFRNILQQCRDRLESTRGLKLRCSLLRKDDYVEVIGICRENICSLQAIMHNLSNSEATTSNNKQIKDLMRSWRDLLHWNEIAMAARELLDEMLCIKRALNHLGSSSYTMLDTESYILTAIESLKKEKLQLTAFRSQMLRLNAAVHNWLIKQGHELLLEQIDDEHFAKKPSKEIEQQLLNNLSGSTETTITTTTTTNTTTATPMSNELEFHRKLRNEVSDMYLAWDVAESRITQQLDGLKASLVTWRQLDNGLSEFQQVLGEDRGTLEDPESAGANLVAKLLLSKQQSAVENQPINQGYYVPKFAVSTTSCSSDSGISDGGALSDSGLSEREHRLNALRRLAKQLECTFAPSSAAMTSISARIESAEAELKQLQYICQVLIERTENAQNSSKIKSKRHLENNHNNNNTQILEDVKSKSLKKNVVEKQRTSNTPWYWRIIKFALPLHLALLTLICLTVFLQPHCCDNMNSYYISFIPQLRYIQGPPPY